MSNTVLGFKRANHFYKLFCDSCVVKNLDMSAYPVPISVEVLLLTLHASQRDRASNEQKRIAGMNAAKLHAFEKENGRKPTAEKKGELALVDGTCGTHSRSCSWHQKCRDADHGVLVQRLGEERDMTIWEFRSANTLDSLQLQFQKLFGHHSGAYVFGDGFTAFPTWVEKEHPGKLKKMQWVVGNRALIFCLNAIVHFCMLVIYVTWTSYIIRRIGSGDMPHVRVDAKARTVEVFESLRACAILYTHVLGPL